MEKYLLNKVCMAFQSARTTMLLYHSQATSFKVYLQSWDLSYWGFPLLCSKSLALSKCWSGFSPGWPLKIGGVNFLSSLLPCVPDACKAFTNCCKAFSDTGIEVGMGNWGTWEGSSPWVWSVAGARVRICGCGGPGGVSVCCGGHYCDCSWGGCCSSGSWSSWPWASETPWGVSAGVLCWSWFGFLAAIVTKYRQVSGRPDSMRK